MNILDFYCSFYSRLQNYCFPFWVMTPARRVVRYMASKQLPYYLSNSVNPQDSISSDVIVSFTSFPARINNVWQVVECMLRQSLKPKKILLWLSKDQFPHKRSIPERLYSMQNDTFVIRLVDGDIRSHKKYLYVSQEYANSPVLLIDDDIYYPTDFIKRFYEAYKRTSKVIGLYGYIIKFKNDGSVETYSNWMMSYDETDDSNFFFGSGGGVMFVPSSLYKDLIDINLALKLCPTADDIWLNAMVRLGKQKTHKLKSGLFLPIKQESVNTTLASENVFQKKNDTQIKALNDYYLKKEGIKVFGV